MIVKTSLNIGAAIFAVIAAALWWLSSRVRVPHQFPIQVVSNNTMAEQVIGAQVVSIGSSAELDDLAWAFIKQSRLSAWAATSAGLSAFLQGVANLP